MGDDAVSDPDDDDHTEHLTCVLFGAVCGLLAMAGGAPNWAISAAFLLGLVAAHFALACRDVLRGTTP
jgi:hypothetical protein